MLLEAQYLGSNDFTKIKIKAAQNLWRKMLNLIHQIVFNEIKVKKKKEKVPINVIFKKQSTSKKFLLEKWFLISSLFFFENFTTQNLENAPYHIKSVCDVLKIPAPYPCRAMQGECNWFFTKNWLPIIIRNWMEITLII